MNIPVSTYRVQLNASFTFVDLQEILDYLQDLGISSIYASPIFKASKGSTHGYDVLDPYSLNKEIGTLERFRKISGSLREKKMGWLQDIVPNHMAYDGNNPWIWDILELGPESDHYHFFDIDWEESGKVMAPFLGGTLQEVLEKGEISLNFNGKGFSFRYFEHLYPASAPSYLQILEKAGVGNWIKRFKEFSGNDMAWEDLKTGFFREVQGNGALKENLESRLSQINNSPDLLKEILELQYFRPVHWKTTEKEINYRRFFTINGLICVRAEDEEVFESYHYFLRELYKQNLVDGLRVDHVDGLHQPSVYLQRLRKFIGDDAFIVVEKIQESEEPLPKDWPVQGSSGYDFLALVNQLFTDSDNKDKFLKAYKEIAPEMPEYDDLVFEKKLYIFQKEMGGELKNLMSLLQKLGLKTDASEIDDEDLQKALAAFLAGFPVYRIYPEAFPLKEGEKEILNIAHEEALRYFPEREKELAFLKSILMGEAEKDNNGMLEFLQRTQQFTGPLAAKGVEDTVFYHYNLLISHNEVGDAAGDFGMNVREFHERMELRQQQYPLSINATATHDTKRGEDARMRINVLSEMPEEWFGKVREWQDLAQKILQKDQLPDANEIYFIFQTLIGGFPFLEKEREDFIPRVEEYLQKALREAKFNSSWADPDEDYEKMVTDFVKALMGDEEFLSSFETFQEKIASFGVLKSLGQTLIKITAPGIPDIYQGTEFWDFSFVDPDNRRKVDYDLRQKTVAEFNQDSENGQKEDLKLLRKNHEDGKIKMYLLNKALSFRQSNRELFEKGEYLPLSVEGENSEKILAYARNWKGSWAVVVVPVSVTPFFESRTTDPKQELLKNLKIVLPEEAPSRWTSVLDGKSYSSKNLGLEELLSDFPVALISNID